LEALQRQALQWHGRHLPLGNDALKAHAILVKTAERSGGVVYPPVYFHEGFPRGSLVPDLMPVGPRGVRPERTEQLLEQELPVTSEQYTRCRHQLSERLRRTKREEKTMRTLSKIAWSVTGLFMLMGAVVDFNRDRFTEFARLSLITATVLSLACATALLVIYLLNYRSRVGRGQQEVILLELHRQLSAIRGLDSSGKQPASERHGSKTTQTTGQ
jgi:hypothetical protein